jgi:hypothetical protein
MNLNDEYDRNLIELKIKTDERSSSDVLSNRIDIGIF